ncbi:ABC transporter ATP-binding protein/permease [Tessaracoccus caeni]|uniref:ABC transporter ATP-binding protein/permease n=1 Tax=Tessaracoccus caeni TaxID=3031239 RepID=UPI0023DB4857|nr:ABC transporter ATP-binding protein/permease [Tessaracoccus caeni]MDF1486973.1 ABC transporter ATP-binding protein/permease [Tessaracoccus caeni]
MLELRDVRKSYTTGDFTQVALNDVSIAFRDNEFVAILGPSGSGKTTLLNIVGGLDHYDSGNLIIDGIATERYRDRDWDTYRNNRIGFVFQSYNLIPHQSVLANVELALTLAGVSRAERRERAKAALDEVGLGDHVHKRPNQLSGGQMQRVAIARALVNDPEILLADEPTGALDSKTSVQIMALLTSIAKDRLVIMVTHNPELAAEYATRIVHLSDGVISDDSHPYYPHASDERDGRPARRTSMSFLTAIALSFNNLMTKKGRTLMTAFAGSIGIIGIAAILALANGVNSYIKGVEEDTLSLYPLSIQRQGMDMTAMLASSSGMVQEVSGTRETKPGHVREVQAISKMFSSVGTNDLESLKHFLDTNGGGIDSHVNSIQYAYDVSPQIFASDTSDGARQINPDTSFDSLGFGGMSANSMLSASMSTNVFHELMEDRSLIDSHFELVAGQWPTAADETLIVLTPSGGFSDFGLYAMGLRDPAELDEMVRQVIDEEKVEPPGPPLNVSYEEIMDVTFTLVDAADFYTYDDEFDVWTDRKGDKGYVKDLVEEGDELRVAGIVKPTDDSARLQPGIYYTRALTTEVIDRAARSEIARSQLDATDTDVFTGRRFGEEPDQEEFDFASMFTIDEKKIAKAFTFDQSKLKLDMSGLESGFSGMDLSLADIQIDPSKMPALDLDGIIAGLDLADIIQLPEPDPDAEQPGTQEPDTDQPMPTIDPEQLGLILTQLGEGYAAFAAANGLDPVDVATNLPVFLASPDGQALIASAGEGLDTEQLDAVLQGYVAFALENELDPVDPTTTLPEFVASEEGQELLGIADALTPDPNAGLVERLIQGYLVFTIEKGLDPTDAQKNFTAFLESDAGKALLGEARSYINTDAIQSQLQGVLGDYMQKVMAVYMEDVGSQLASALGDQIGSALESNMGDLAKNMGEAMGVDQEAFMEAFKMERSPEQVAQLLMSVATTQTASLESNLRKLGYADFDDPSRIDIYPRDFESKGEVTRILDEYNDRMRGAGSEDQVVTYTDIVGVLMSSVTEIVNMISNILIAFVAISLVVSSIMIGVITYISVLERKKEIGILRSIGASKRDIRRVFNAETLIVGFVAGALGVTITFLLTIPANAIVYANFDVPNIAQLPLAAAGILVLISMTLTALAGLIPSTAASRKDPVEALRSE